MFRQIVKVGSWVTEEVNSAKSKKNVVFSHSWLWMIVAKSGFLSLVQMLVRKAAILVG